MCEYPKMYAGAMRLARKYDAQKILDTFASGLRRIFPSKLEHALRVWDAFKESAASFGQMENQSSVNRQFFLLVDCRIDSVFPDAGKL